MKKNVGKIDRSIRIIIGLIIAAAGIYFKNWWGLLGIALIVVGLVRFCPLYVPFKISTNKRGSE
jgi:type IV secretory pathway TrbD component